MKKLLKNFANRRRFRPLKKVEAMRSSGMYGAAALLALSGAMLVSQGNAAAWAQDADTPVMLDEPQPEAARKTGTKKVVFQKAEAAAEAGTDIEPVSQDMFDDALIDLGPDRREKAYGTAVDGIMPLSPEQIRTFRTHLDDSQEAAQEPVGPPRAVVHVENLSLDPGVEPPEMKMATGYVTTLTMLDSTGQPWPIKDFGVGGNFDVPQPEDGSHILRIVPLTQHGAGNLSLRMVGLATPIAFRLTSGSDVIHYRFDARIPKLGPGAKTPLIDRGVTITAGDETLMKVLSGIAPEGFERMDVAGSDSQTSVWKNGDLMYVRTPLTLLSPGWNGSVTSADGTNVYEIAASPVLLLSDSGAMVRVRIGTKEAVQ